MLHHTAVNFNCLAHILIIIASPYNKFLFVEMKSDSRFPLICLLKVYYDSQVLHVLGECSILAISE